MRAGDREWLADLEIGVLRSNVSALSGTLDQSALHGVLRRLQHLALEIYEVHRLCGCLERQHSARVAVPVS
jgi:hypothetical protein